MYLDPAPMTVRPVADMLADLAADRADLARRAPEDRLPAVLGRVRAYVPGVLVASIARVRSNEVPATVAASDEVAAAADRRQLEAGEGPLLTALAGTMVVACGAELVHRWPDAAPHLAELGVAGVLALPLPGLSGEAALNLYADEPFPPHALPLAVDTAAVAAVAVTALAAQERAENLEIALSSSRQIAAAVGIVMALERCSYDQAFARIRRVSQHTHRKMRDIADDVLLTGALPEPETGGAEIG